MAFTSLLSESSLSTLWYKVSATAESQQSGEAITLTVEKRTPLLRSLVSLKHSLKLLWNHDVSKLGHVHTFLALRNFWTTNEVQLSNWIVRSDVRGTKSAVKFAAFDGIRCQILLMLCRCTQPYKALMSRHWYEVNFTEKTLAYLKGRESPSSNSCLFTLLTTVARAVSGVVYKMKQEVCLTSCPSKKTVSTDSKHGLTLKKSAGSAKKFLQKSFIVLSEIPSDVTGALRKRSSLRHTHA